MPPEVDELVTDDEDQEPEGPVSTSMSAATVRDSPEYRETERRRKAEARRAAKAERENAELRAALERQRADAESAASADEEAQLLQILGEDGVAAWNQFAELSGSNQTEAARYFRSLIAGAQSAAAAPAAPPSQPASEETPVSSTVPAPPSRTVEGSAPLAPMVTTEDEDALIAELDARVQATIDRNQNPSTRNRVTMRERATAMIDFVHSSVLKQTRAKRNA